MKLQPVGTMRFRRNSAQKKKGLKTESMVGNGDPCAGTTFAMNVQSSGGVFLKPHPERGLQWTFFE